MNLRIEPSRVDDLKLLEQLENESFDINRRYFQDGLLPGFSDEERDEFSPEALFYYQKWVLDRRENVC